MREFAHKYPDFKLVYPDDATMDEALQWRFLNFIFTQMVEEIEENGEISWERNDYHELHDIFQQEQGVELPEMFNPFVLFRVY